MAESSQSLAFYCKRCGKKFQSAGEKEEYESPIYGPCWKRVADCPVCGNRCEEHRIKWPKRGSEESEDSSEQVCSPEGCSGCGEGGECWDE